jgi:hypothetical protein
MSSKKPKKNEKVESHTETGAQEAQRLTREATKSRTGGALGPTVAPASNDSPQPGTEDVPDAK